MGRLYWSLRVLCLLLVLILPFEVDCSLSFSSSALNYSTPLCQPEDSSALLQFKTTISIHDSDDPICPDSMTSYPKTKSWNESTNCCSWEGVTCDKVTGHVIGLDLSCSSLVGSLPVNSSLFLLKGLKRLNLAYNNFNGSSIPSGFSHLVSLTHLNLSRSNFVGLVPSDISLLSKLISLDLSCGTYLGLKFDSHSFGMLTRNLSELRNVFLGGVNMSDVVATSLINLTSSLKHLSLPYCQLRGEFPSEIFHLQYLEYLDLRGNHDITGYLPKSNWSSPLRFLDLGSCAFRGSVPLALGNLTKITLLDLSLNNFEAQLPNAFGNLNKLTTLAFSACNISGQLPSTLMNLTQLSQLRFSFNKLEGPLPSHVSGLQNLKEFQSISNLLSGGIPSWLFTLPSLEYLDLSYNRLTGPIDQIQKPSSVQQVYLANNDIHGEIPRSFFDLANLTHLDLSSNNLSGVIKSDLLSKLENLQMLDLSSNNFSGLIKPDLLSKLKNLQRLHLSNNKLLSLSSGSGINYTFLELVTLSLSSCNVSRFPSFLRTGKNLRVLDLSDNKIGGSIFKWELEGWEQLTILNLSYNLLTSLEQFPGKNLEILDLRSNLLQGPLLAPPPSLQQFFISNNKLTGKIPPLICNMSSLEILDLSRNNLGGTIPACLGNFSYLLSTINLQMNNFHGKIPDSFVVGNSLTYLVLSDNQFEGLLPRSLSNCFLRILDLANNKLNDTFPHWLGVSFLLKVLVLRSNRFHGPLDNLIVTPSFMSLQLIDLSQNEFSGLLPSSFFQNLFAMKYTRPVSPTGMHITSFPEGIGSLDDSSVNVTSKRLELELELKRTLLIFFAIDFSSNQFYGKIPEVIGELSSVQMLNLSHNSLTGHIPTSLGNLVALESLDLSSNKLDGRIPSQLTNLTFLEVLNLSENNLVGPIPNGNQFSTFENDSYSGNLGLCGFPLSKQCGNNEGSKSPAPKFKEDEGSALAFIWKLVVMGYGCGLVLGLSTGYIVFTTGRPWWFVRMVERDWQNNVTKWIRRNKRRRN